MSDAERSRRYRDAKRGGPPRQPAPCGTYAAARRHQRRGEVLDEACAEALRAYVRGAVAQSRSHAAPGGRIASTAAAARRPDSCA